LTSSQFGPGELPNHGFARTSLWTNVSGEVVAHGDGTAVQAKFQLEQNDETLSIWPFNFVLTYT
jgi:glucose-6-phosphate 1-epimerase